jgi:preprotein translocase subunit SecA
MDYLREGIGLRAMGQRDPLVEYQREGFEMFSNLMGRIREEFTRYIFHVSAAVEEAPHAPRARNVQYTAPAKTSDAAEAQQRAQRQAQIEQAQAGAQSQMAAGGSTMAAGQAEFPEDGADIVYETVRREGDKVGRNDLCPCGSGKKYKKCHGVNA